MTADKNVADPQRFARLLCEVCGRPCAVQVGDGIEKEPYRDATGRLIAVVDHTFHPYCRQHERKPVLKLRASRGGVAL